jgi:hypothetical protein
MSLSPKIFPFSIDQVRITTFDVTPQVIDLPETTQFNISLLLQSGRAEATVGILSVVSKIIGAEWSTNLVGLPMDVLAAMLGLTATEAGTTPDQTLTLDIIAATTNAVGVPYVIIEGRAISELGDDLEVKIWKAKVTNNVQANMQYGQFPGPQLGGVAVRDTGNSSKIVTFTKKETAAALATS